MRAQLAYAQSLWQITASPTSSANDPRQEPAYVYVFDIHDLNKRDTDGEISGPRLDRLIRLRVRLEQVRIDAIRIRKQDRGKRRRVGWASRGARRRELKRSPMQRLPPIPPGRPTRCHYVDLPDTGPLATETVCGRPTSAHSADALRLPARAELG